MTTILTFQRKNKEEKKRIDLSFLFSMCSKSNNCLPILCKKIQTKFAGFLNFYFADIACIFAKAMNLYYDVIVSSSI